MTLKNDIIQNGRQNPPTSHGILSVNFPRGHYSHVIMGSMASQITSLAIVYLSFYSGADQSKHQSSASPAFVSGIRRRPVNYPHKGPVTWKIFPFNDVIMWCIVCDRRVMSILLPTRIQSSQWRHNGRDGCLLNRLFRRRSKKAFRVTGLCERNSPVILSPHENWILKSPVNTYEPNWNGWHFADDILKWKR